MTAPGELRDVLGLVVAAQVRQAKRQRDRDGVRAGTRLLREVRALPDADPRLVALCVFPVEVIAGAIPDDTPIPAGSAGQFLDALAGYVQA